MLEVGANVGRNLYWIRRAFPQVRVHGFDVAGQNVEEGRSLFGLIPEELWVGDERSLAALPDNYVDLVFTVSVLDHIPDVATTLTEMLRVATVRVILIELVLPQHGKVTDPRVVGYSYSHDYLSLIARLPCQLSSHVRTPLGEGVLEYYETFELTPDHGHGPSSER